MKISRLDNILTISTDTESHCIPISDIKSMFRAFNYKFWESHPALIIVCYSPENFLFETHKVQVETKEMLKDLHDNIYKLLDKNDIAHIDPFPTLGA